MRYESNDLESLTEPLAKEVRRLHNQKGCLRGWPQFPPGQEDEFFGNVVWSVLLGLDDTEFRLVHISQLPGGASTVSDQIQSTARTRPMKDSSIRESIRDFLKSFEKFKEATDARFEVLEKAQGIAPPHSESKPDADEKR